MQFMDKIHLILVSALFHNIMAVGAAGVRGPLYIKGATHLSPFVALFFPDSKQIPLYCWVTEIPSHWMAKPGFEVTTLPSAP